MHANARLNLLPLDLFALLFVRVLLSLFFSFTHALKHTPIIKQRHTQ